MTYTFAGKEHTLGADELEAVERSGRSSWQVYAMQPGEWPEPCIPVTPLLNARPGATEAQSMIGIWNTDRNGVSWTYDELCELFRCSPSSHSNALEWGKQRGRSSQAVQAQMIKLVDLVVNQKLRWDGERLLRGKRAQVYQWPVGFKNKPCNLQK